MDYNEVARANDRFEQRFQEIQETELDWDVTIPAEKLSMIYRTVLRGEKESIRRAMDYIADMIRDSSPY